MGQIFDEETLAQSQERLSRLLAETSEETHASKEHLQRFVQELSTALEELMVADEELRAQGAQLAASVAVIDAERERYGELFEFAPDAYLVTDGEAKIVEANGAASRMLGVPARYLAGKLLISFVDDAVRRDLRDMLATLGAAEATAADRYLQIRPREGPILTVEARAVGQRTKDQTVLRWMLRDITQRLRLEEDIRSLHAEVELLASLSQIARLTSDPQPLDIVLGHVVDVAVQALPGCEVSVALAADGRAHFAASSGDRGRRLDTAQIVQGDGPCLASMRDGVVVEKSTSEAAARWPTFGAAAQEVGLVAAHGHPLTTPGGQRGALNVYAFAPISDETRAFIPLLAEQVVVALTNAELYEGAHTLASHLQLALESRGVIEQAKGVLIARQGCSDDEAFDILRRASQRLNRKLRDVAGDVVAHVQAPKAPAPPVDGGSDASAAAARGRETRASDRAPT